MADFVMIKGDHDGYEQVNLDLVRHITEDMDGNITLHFSETHRMTLNGGNSRFVMQEVNNRWRATASRAA
jgi:hypothetical protein